MINKIILAATFLIFLISFATADVSHPASEINVDIGGSTQTLQQMYNDGDFGKWEDSLNPGDIYYDVGNVGVGTTVPGAKLDVAASGDEAKALRIGIDRDWCFMQEGTGSNTALKISSDCGGSNNNKNFIFETTGLVSIPSGGLCLQGDCRSSWVSCSDCDSRFVERSGDSMSGSLGVNGNLGIGTTSPDRKLHIVNDGGMLRMQGETHAYMEYYPWGSTNRGAYTGFPSDGSIDFWIENEADEGDIVLQPGDSAGPGSPVGDVVIAGSGRRLVTQYDGIEFGNELYRIYAENSRLIFKGHTNGYYWLGDTGSNIIMKLEDSEGLTIYPTAVGSTSICRTGSPGRFAICSSLRKYKKDIENLELGIGTVENLRPVAFTWKQDNKEDLGFIAEEVYKVDPLLIEYGEDGEMEGVKYKQLTAVLTRAVQEQQDMIDELEQKVELQQNQIDSLLDLVSSQ